MIGGLLELLIVFMFLMAPAIFALSSLRKTDLDQLVKVIWVVLIIIFPLIGPIAFFVVRPGESKQTEV